MFTWDASYPPQYNFKIDMKYTEKSIQGLCIFCMGHQVENIMQFASNSIDSYCSMVQILSKEVKHREDFGLINDMYWAYFV